MIAKQREEDMRYFEVENPNTQFNVAPPTKQIVYTSTGEGGETLLNFGGVQ